MKNCIICGSRFGQFYIEAIRKHDDINICGLLANGSQRSVDCAEFYQLNLYTHIDEIPSHIDFACVAIKSEVQGGQGNIIAKKLLQKGIDVIFEQPISEREYAELYGVARKNQRYFAICNLYSRLPSVQNFIENYQIIKKEQDVKYINFEFATQLSYPVAEILCKLLPAFVNEPLPEKLNNDGPYHLLSTNLNGIQLNLSAYNEVRDDIDQFMRQLFNIKIGFQGGELALTDPHGNVQWREYIHFPKEHLLPYKLKDHPPLGMQKNNIETIYSSYEQTQQLIFTELWTRMIFEEINLYLNQEYYSKKCFNSKAQSHINHAMAWKKLMQAFGYPQKTKNDFYAYFDVSQFKYDIASDDDISGQLHRLERVCALTMLYVLGKYLDKKQSYMLDDIFERLEVHPNNKDIMSRWLNYLVDHFYVIKTMDNAYIFDYQTLTKDNVQHEWNHLEQQWITSIMPKKIFQYFKAHFEHIEAIVRGDKPVNLILFEHGDIDIANALYRHTAIARYINTQIALYVQTCAEHRRLNILELGAGTGATTTCILKQIGQIFTGSYLFTDISQYFISLAKKQFVDKTFMRYQLLNIDNLHHSKLNAYQPIDIVIAVGVINNAKNLNRLLKSVHQILTKGGKLIIGEAYGESAPMLISQAFMMTEPTDIRKSKNTTFLTLDEWYELFNQTGFKLLDKKPQQSDELASFKQALFILEKR
ncbi:MULTISPECIES: bifunctional Gfo/Idh/MocA family oxidoreductase/class I SAM-dependent methyltransferase [Staphylococcus]|uniref:bifunctional Gfo/Idh/MocA family oxidoreductase/class I SAM-dependent methyltransferase n=1 Tax=Staphylococcus TaxID=1279 RepID=UPI0001C54A35|nr:MULTISPECIES: bifunctional Gfo/Idh/MocA family oxidoreductase/class I SAM-dependent methyltransferase [Staphylococcus]ADC88016.1 polyketide synthase [Staphylococcus lugdunensis HKU09-01]ARJ09760.1 polyketide synthase [Staphylococcus lugdunensis]ARJ16797.1 polyketide synthase [Staphylococcus lugdunensis]MCH8639451.1 bifunctional Gfo/Idh/MocA family oxidoreductase/class I SAM-dependent methyltransferase [Staphylococcus lugdunensis]MCH8650725.1 bifunctional Gfo/Idh/MocA family oxidoreductase/c